MIYAEKGIKKEVEDRESRRLEDARDLFLGGLLLPLSTLELSEKLEIL